MVGDLAKLVFEPGERMWVEVTGRSDAGRYIGTLRNNPVSPGVVGVTFGEFVTFDPEHICAIEVPAAPGSPDITPVRPRDDGAPEQVAPAAWPTPADIAALDTVGEAVSHAKVAAMHRTIEHLEGSTRKWWLRWHLLRWHDRSGLSAAATMCPVCHATPPTLADLEEDADG